MALILCCSVLGKPGSWRPQEKCIPSLKSLGIKSNGVRSFLALTERDTPTGSNRPEQAWMMCLFGSFSGENSFVIKTSEIWKSLYPSTTGQFMMDLPMLCLSGLHWHPLVRKLWWRKALHGGFAHLCTQEKLPCSLSTDLIAEPRFMGRESSQSCWREVLERLDLTLLEGVCLSVSVRGITIVQGFRQ